MELKDIQAAISDVERSMRKVKNKIDYRDSVIAAQQREVDELRVEYGSLVDRYTALVAEEQRIIRPGSVT